MRDDELGIVGIHRQRAADDDLARNIARLLQHIGESRPVHGQKERVRAPGGLRRRAGQRVAAGDSRGPLELRLAARVAENHLMPRAREERAELATHQSRAKNADAHGGVLFSGAATPPRFYLSDQTNISKADLLF